jgi:hypothetical protein
MNSLTSLAGQGWILLSNKTSSRALLTFNSAGTSASHPYVAAHTTVSAELISSNTVIVLVLPPTVIQDCFRLQRPGNSHAPLSLMTLHSQTHQSRVNLQDPNHPLHIRPYTGKWLLHFYKNMVCVFTMFSPGIMVPERVRRAVLEPLEPVAVINPLSTAVS